MTKPTIDERIEALREIARQETYGKEEYRIAKALRGALTIIDELKAETARRDSDEGVTTGVYTELYALRDAEAKLEAENARLRAELRRLSGNAQELAKRWGKDLINLSLDVQLDVKANMVSGLSDE